LERSARYASPSCWKLGLSSDQFRCLGGVLKERVVSFVVGQKSNFVLASF
jgi:hypothetical protein